MIHPSSAQRLSQPTGAENGAFVNTYSLWLGHEVYLQVRNEEFLVPLHGRIVNESRDSLRFRLDNRWDVDIFKEMIHSVEPATVFSAAG
jgi:hypothetical protein